MGNLIQLSVGNSVLGLTILLDAAVKGLAVLTVAAVVTLAMRRRSAALRHLVWTVSVLGLLGIPVLSVTLPEWRVPLLPSWATVPALVPPVLPATVTTPSALPPVAVVPGDPSPQLHRNVSVDATIPPRTEPLTTMTVAKIPAALSPAPSWLIWILFGWAAGVLAMALPLVIGTVGIRLARRNALAVADPEWLDLLERLRPQLGIKRPVALLRSSQSVIPLTCGVWRPMILLPQEADSWTAAGRTMVLLHELAHIRRGDCLTQLLARLVRVLYWFNPLVWLAGRMLRIERERACDDLVLAAGHKPADYASHLLEIVRSLQTMRCPSLGAVAMAKRSQFEGRLLAILDPRLRRGKLTRLAILVVAMLMVGMTVPLACMKATTADTKPAAAVVNKDKAPWGAAVEGVQVRLRAEKAQWKADEKPTLAIDLRVTDRGYSFFDANTELQRWEVTVDGRRYWWTDRTAKQDVGWEATVKAGEERLNAAALVLPGPFVAQDDGKPLVLSPGKHTVRLSMRPQPFTPIPAGTPPAPVTPEIGNRIVSNPVEIEILPADAKAAVAIPGDKMVLSVRNGRVQIVVDDKNVILDDKFAYALRDVDGVISWEAVGDQVQVSLNGKSLTAKQVEVNLRTATFEAKPAAVPIPANIQSGAKTDATKLTPEQVKLRHEALAAADQKLRDGLKELAKSYPQLATANNKPLDEAMKEFRATPGEVDLILGRSNTPVKAPWAPEAIADDQTWSIRAVMHAARPPTPAGTPISAADGSLRPMYPRLGLEGTWGASAGDVKLDEALRNLLIAALTPLKELDQRIAAPEPDVLPPTQPEELWQKDVSVFIDTLKKAVDENVKANGGRIKLDELSKTFKGKPIRWSGELKYVHLARPYFRNTFVRTAKDESMSVVEFFPLPVNGRDPWEQVKPGTVVAYAGTITEVKTGPLVDGVPFVFVEVSGTTPVAEAKPTTEPTPEKVKSDEKAAAWSAEVLAALRLAADKSRVDFKAVRFQWNMDKDERVVSQDERFWLDTSGAAIGKAPSAGLDMDGTQARQIIDQLAADGLLLRAEENRRPLPSGTWCISINQYRIELSRPELIRLAKRIKKILDNKQDSEYLAGFVASVEAEETQAHPLAVPEQHELLVKDLLAALIPLLPTGWGVERAVSLQHTAPSYWDGSGQGFVIEFRPKGLTNDELRAGHGGYVGVCVMDSEYTSSKVMDGLTPDAQVAREFSRWRGRRVFVTSQPNNWKTWEADLRACLKKTDVAESTPANVKSGERPATVPSPVLNGKVVDPDGKPVPGAEVIGNAIYNADGERATNCSLAITADGNGGFQLPMNPPTGKVVLGYVLVGVTVPERNLAALVELKKFDQPITIKLVPGLTLTGTVKDSAGRPVAGVEVEAMIDRTTSDGFALRKPDEPYAKTDAQGHYEIKGLPPKLNYIVRVNPHEQQKLGVSYIWLDLIGSEGPGGKTQERFKLVSPNLAKVGDIGLEPAGSYEKISLSDLQLPKIESLVGKKFEVKGTVFDTHVKGLDHLCQDDNQKIYVDLSYQGDYADVIARWKYVYANCGRQLLVRGTIGRIAPMPKPKPGEPVIQWAYDTTFYPLEVDSVEVVK